MLSVLPQRSPRPPRRGPRNTTASRAAWMQGYAWTAMDDLKRVAPMLVSLARWNARSPRMAQADIHAAAESLVHAREQIRGIARLAEIELTGGSDAAA